MNAVKPLIILFLACGTYLAGFSQAKMVLNYLPKDVKMIIKINSTSLGQKMKWADFAKTGMFEEITKDASQEGKTFLKNSAPTGIDMSQGIFAVMPVAKNSEKTEPIFYGALSSPSQFSVMIKKVATEPHVVKLANGELVISKKTAIAWNKDVFVIIEDEFKDLSTSEAAKPKTADDMAKTKRLTERCKALLNKQKAPLDDQRFLSLLNEQGDVYVWINNLQSESQKKNKAAQVVDMFNRNMRSSDYTAGVIQFDNGRIGMETKRYISPFLDSLYQKYPPKTLNTQLTQKLPAGRPIFLYSVSFSPAMINEMIVKAGAGQYIDSLGKKGIKMDDLVSVVTGDITAAVMKINESAEADSITQAMSGIQIFLAGGINDKTKFKQLSDLLQANKNDTSKNQQAKKMKPHILLNDSIFVVSLSQNAAQKFLESPANNQELKELISRYARYPNACFIDLKTILGLAMQGAAKNRSEQDKRQMSEVLSMFDKLVTYGGLYEKGALSSTFELTLSNKDENSLKQFINLFELFKLMGNKKSSALQKTPYQLQNR